ncbi:chromatin-remodeling complex subunit ies6 [Sporothrix bragantina]|uniref:Chromatin-remodeling complex subunit ies6 n=1 Tax=Sporothrix bragantina TaxID=671064 RepID=A0ABP0CUS6_9PEZI
MATQTPEMLAAQAAHTELLEQRDMHAIHKTFRNPSWRPNQRRNKNVKTILGDVSRREASALATPQENNSGVNTPRASRGRPGRGAAAATAANNEENDDGLSTSGSTTPAMGTNGNGNGTLGGALPPNLAQANRSLSKLVLEKTLDKNLKPPATAPGATASGATVVFSSSAPSVTYTNVESAPSLAPQRRYCDITGLAAPYTDPKTRLRYHNSEVFGAIRNFQQGVAEQYLEMRGAHTVLK